MKTPLLEPLHPLHLMYVIADPHREEKDLRNFFTALREADPLHLRWMIGFASSGIGTGTVPDLPSEEEESSSALLAFQNRCQSILDSGLANFFLSYGIVTYICNHLRTQGDPDCAAASARWLTGAKEFFRECAAAGQVSKEFAEKSSRMVDERVNNSLADAELARDRYNLFCDKVVRRMLPAIQQADA